MSGVKGLKDVDMDEQKPVETADHHSDDDDASSGRGSKQSGLPVDRGWAWLVLLASFFNIMISNGNYRSFGILFTEIQHRYKSSSSLTALIASCLNASYSICSLLVATVGFKYFSSRQLVATSAILFSITYALAGQVTSIEMTILLLGLLSGVGHALVSPPTTALLSRYFEKRRSLANGIAVTGGSAGSLLFSLIIRIYLEKFAYTGTMLLLGGISLQILVCAMLMRPPSFYERYTRRRKDKSNEDAKALENNVLLDNVDTDAMTDNKIPPTKVCIDEKSNEWVHDKNFKSMPNTCSNRDNQQIITNSNSTSNEPPMINGIIIKELSEVTPENVLKLKQNSHVCPYTSLPTLKHVDAINELESPLLNHLTPKTRRAQLAMTGRNRTVSERTKPSLVQRLGSSLSAVSTSNIGGFASTELSISISSMVNLAGSVNRLNRTRENKAAPKTIEKVCYESDEKCYKTIARKVNCSAFNFGILKRPSFQLFIFCACLIVHVSSIQMFLPPFAIDCGISSKDSDFLITIISIVEIFGTVTMGFIADKQIIQRHKIITIAVCSIACVAFAAPFFRSYGAFVCFSVWYGFFGRVYFGLYPILLVDFFGIENLGPTLGIVSVSQTGFNAVIQPIVGLLRDKSGSYVPGFLLMTSCNLVGGLGLLLLPFMQRLEKRRQKTQNLKSMNNSV